MVSRDRLWSRFNNNCSYGWNRQQLPCKYSSSWWKELGIMVNSDESHLQCSRCIWVYSRWVSTACRKCHWHSEGGIQGIQEERSEGSIFYIHQCVEAKVFGRIAQAAISKEVWDMLENYYGGDAKVKKVCL